jgi:hypothetical protein
LARATIAAACPRACWLSSDCTRAALGEAYRHYCPWEGIDMKSTFRKVIPCALLGLALAIVAAPSMADTAWQKSHPRREQVNSRLNHQNSRIHNEVKEGEMSKSQAASLHHEDHQVRQEERDMASQNGGHITKQEQATLNSQENGISRQIGR